MSTAQTQTPPPPGLVFELLAIAPHALGGIALRGLAGPGREAAFARLDELIQGRVSVPVNASEDRLLGGLDLSTTLRAGEPVYEHGLLHRAHNGLLVLSMAERLSDRFIALICQPMDAQKVMVERDGLSVVSPCAATVVALDESMLDDEHLAAPLADRLAFALSVDELDAHQLREGATLHSQQDVQNARERFRRLDVSDDALAAISNAALSLGIPSIRSSIHAAIAARAIAALDHADSVSDRHAAIASQLVFAHRARQLPPPVDMEQDEHPDPSDAPPPPQDNDNAAEEDSSSQPNDAALHDSVVEAVRAALPEHVLKMLASGAMAQAQRAGRGAQSGSPSGARGRPIGVRAVPEIGREKLNVLATVKAAAPWQKLRGGSRGRVRVLPDDFRVTRFKPKLRTTTVFVVDASGSSAARRLAEVKGAVELLLAECYVTRARVAVVAFRGERAEVLLEPTRSLTRARRQLADLPGGGATPLADAIDVTRELCTQLLRQSEQAQVIFLTDGHGNVGRDGVPGHPDAVAHALDAAAELSALALPCMLVDTSRRPRDRARRMADAMGARYLPLPYADSGALAQAVSNAA